MTIRNLGLGALIIASCVVWLVFPGCSDPNEPKQKPAEIVNSDKPNSNARIVSQTTLGEASKWSYLSGITTDHAGGYYFRGGYNSYYTVGRLNASGNLSWFFRTSHSPTGVCAGPPVGIVSNGLIVAGKKDLDDDGESEIGFASLFSSGGSLINQLVYSADTSDVWLNSIVPVADSTFLVVGGVRALAVEHPFIATIVLTSAGQLEKKHQAIISTLPACYFSDPAVDTSLAAGSSWSFYVTSSTSDGHDAVHKITVALPELAPWTVDWSFEVSVPSIQDSWVDDMCFFGGNLYVAGGIRDPDKTPLPSNGGYWTSGMAASITSAGGARWTKVVRVTKHSDVFRSVTASADGVYAVGDCAEFIQQDQQFGYGWISKLSESTGGVVSNSTFGDLKYRSGFRTGIVEGDVIHCGGWTQQEVGDVYRGWFCDVDISTSAAQSLSSVPARIGDHDQVIPEDCLSGTDNGR
jgi:hypothetical protein